MTASGQVAALLAATLVLAACTGAGAVATTSPSSAAATGSAPSGSDVGPATTVGSATTPGPSPTGAASIAPTGTPAPVPRAELVTAGATVAGTLGTYTMDGSGSDSPWLPFGALPAVAVGASETPSLRFIDRSPSATSRS
ncbi:MAG: hypothetical protein HY264_01970 [Chloroflexi bacterium]|nr:hypothetical protein [Chloroflexota bacterium]